MINVRFHYLARRVALLECESEHHLYILNFSAEVVQSSLGEVHGTSMHNSTVQKRKSSRLYYVSMPEPCVRQKTRLTIHHAE